MARARRLIRAEPHALKARQYLGAEIRHFVEIIHERHCDAAYAGAADIGKLPGDLAGRADKRETADAADGLHLALGGKLRRGRVLRGDVFERQHPIQRWPIGVLYVGVVMILLGFLLGRAADHLSLREYLDLAAKGARLGLDAID